MRGMRTSAIHHGNGVTNVIHFLFMFWQGSGLQEDFRSRVLAEQDRGNP
jgi:hypothetical protein